MNLQELIKRLKSLANTAGRTIYRYFTIVVSGTVFPNSLEQTDNCTTFQGGPQATKVEFKDEVDKELKAAEEKIQKEQEEKKDIEKVKKTLLDADVKEVRFMALFLNGSLNVNTVKGVKAEIEVKKLHVSIVTPARFKIRMQQRSHYYLEVDRGMVAVFPWSNLSQRALPLLNSWYDQFRTGLHCFR